MLLRSQSLSLAVFLMPLFAVVGKGVARMVALMSHFPMKGQDFARFFSVPFLLIVLPFLHNDLLPFQLARPFSLFFFLFFLFLPCTPSPT